MVILRHIRTAQAAFTNLLGYGALVGLLSDFFIRSEVTALDAQNLSEAFAVKRVGLLFLAGFQMTGFTAIQKRGE